MTNIEKSFSLLCDKAKQIQRGHIIKNDETEALLLTAELLQKHFNSKMNRLVRSIF